MIEIKDYNYIRKVILQKDITEYLFNKNINFKLFQYEKDEMIIKMKEKTEFIQFVIEGSIQIYGIKYDGSIYPVRQIDEFTILGDVEFAGEPDSEFFVEAKSRVLCLSILMSEAREELFEDNYFLRFLLKSISKKMMLFSESQTAFNNLEEKLLYYMENECRDNMITSVEKTSFQMRCSRRQLQRILKKLLEEEKIKKVSKGCYIINNN